MKRRDFITLLDGAVATWPLAALGLLMGVADDREGQARVRVLKQGLQELGWIDGRNISIETRFTEPTPTGYGLMQQNSWRLLLT